MDVTQMVVLVLVGLFSLAFVLRLLIGTWKIIYESAPVIVPLLILLGVMFLAAQNGYVQETEVRDANHIESIEDTSGRSGYGK